MNSNNGSHMKKYVKLECKDGNWYFTQGDGKSFISLGINHVEPHYMMGPYNLSSTLKVYGADFITPEGKYNSEGEAVKKWLESAERDMRDWRFNTFGAHTGIPHLCISEDLNYIIEVRAADLETYFKETERPDVFSEEFSQKLDSIAYKLCSLHKARENLLGYSFCDVPEWVLGPKLREIFPYMHPWVLELCKLDASAPGKQAWINVLKQNYPDAITAAETYGVKGSSWEDLARAKDWGNPVNDRASVNDNTAMLSAIAEKWYSLNKLTIRKYDKHHLIFGDKLNGNLPIPDYILPILQRNVDAIFIQWYGRFEEQAETLNRVYSITGKPILMGDSSFSVVQKNQKHSKGIHVNSQEEVGDEYAKYLKQLTSLPYIVGWHYCGYVEGWDGLRAFDENHPFVSYQCGFKTPSGEVHEKAVERVRAANSRVRSY